MTNDQRLMDASADNDERAAEAALRPKSLADFVGQRKVREQLGLVLSAALGRGTAPDHILLSGPPGLGKTTLAMIVAAELGMPLRITSGPAIQHAGDLAAILSSLSEGEVLFLDEIHRMARPAEEMLYMAMEDFRVDVVEQGLDRLDRAVLDALLRRFGGGPVGLSTLAVAVGEEPETVGEVAEPFLVRAGLLARTPRGRVATALAWSHLGLVPPAGT